MRMRNTCADFFFFQAEDGIRDESVTGVQTCALPISARAPARRRCTTGRAIEEKHMSNQDETPLRGDAAWQAEKKRIAKRNEAAYARGREAEAERVAALRRQQAKAERREFANLPTQPHEGPDSA